MACEKTLEKVMKNTSTHVEYQIEQIDYSYEFEQIRKYLKRIKDSSNQPQQFDYDIETPTESHQEGSHNWF
ncbi:MAG: hypothetical protein WC812_01770 [Candidatus Pacearchaeota archaeon]|jgi:hypothetical protein